MSATISTAESDHAVQRARDRRLYRLSCIQIIKNGRAQIMQNGGRRDVSRYVLMVRRQIAANRKRESSKLDDWYLTVLGEHN